MTPVVEFRNLSVRFGDTEAVSDVSFAVEPGEIVAIVGESGSGKSVSALTTLGLLPSTAKVSGAVSHAGVPITSMTPAQLRDLRGNGIAMVFQEPMTALNPLLTIGTQVAEGLRLHRGISRAEAAREALRLLELVGIPEPERRVHQYPHELSGGQRQRVVIAMAVSCDPEVIVADEPTTALDVTVQAEILALLRRLRDELGTAIVLITHSMGVVAELADRVIVMYRGEVVEDGDVFELFEHPRHAYTRSLLDAVPRFTKDVRPGPAAGEGPAALQLDGVVVDFGRFRAVEGVTLEVAPGEILGLVGESGSGKTTIGRVAVGLVRPSAGSVRLFGTELNGLRGAALRTTRARAAMVFQDPASSLDPRMTVGDTIAEPMVLQKVGDRLLRQRRAAELVDAVALPSDALSRYPHELSGGQRQRVSIARALALDPGLLIADEPTSALDVSVQATVLELLRSLQRELGFSCLFISHDLAVVDALADRVAVMHRGAVVESGERTAVFTEPRDDYTRALLAAVPVPDPRAQRKR
ncbi:ABC transporter ATP-binding protein [Pseudonocardia sp. TRM90224]|uniref:ABC transporter ATP-binding protein n=1 Tax=Pseudonocardia sp. TRM90224 TaxID=2812678 RepID=UPI001E33CFD0|nr:ABC transporter ATP-binding protein [Pseudonocardia sp. TRM90224]